MGETIERAEELWLVFDMNARQGARTHEMADGTSYPLLASKGYPMPRHHAAVFLKDPAFKVVDPEGRHIKALPEIEAEHARVRALDLPPGHCIARFDELTDGALLARVASRPGGADVARDGDRDAMIAFLKDAPRQAELPRHLRARDTSSPEGADPDVETLDDTASRAMLIRGGSAGARDPLAMGG